MGWEWPPLICLPGRLRASPGLPADGPAEGIRREDRRSTTSTHESKACRHRGCTKRASATAEFVNGRTAGWPRSSLHPTWTIGPVNAPPLQASAAKRLTWPTDPAPPFTRSLRRDKQRVLAKSALSHSVRQRAKERTKQFKVSGQSLPISTAVPVAQSLPPSLRPCCSRGGPAPGGPMTSKP